MKQKLLRGKLLEWAVFSVFILGYGVISFFHEPWYDEALSWQIGKCASLKEILFSIPPYEGHPPLWHLVLSIPAKTGVPYEVGLKVTGFLISSASVFLILFKSHLPRIFRLLLPFHYFLFYQYGVIVRPYSIMFLAMIMLGMLLPEREEHPLRVLLVQVLLCLSSAYGIIFAAGISFCIVLEIVKEKGAIRFFKELFSDHRTKALLILLFIAVLLVIDLFPRADGYSNKEAIGGNSLLVGLICSFLTFIPNVTLLNGSWLGIEMISIRTMSISTAELLSSSLLGCLFWTLLICSASKRSLKYLIVPYCLFALFSSTIYFSTHHIGLVLIVLVFWIEYNSRDRNKGEIGKYLLGRICHNEKDAILIRQSTTVLCIACLLVPVYWSISASVQEVRQDYSYGRAVASFIREKDLENCTLFSGWNNGVINVENYNEGHDDYINTYWIDSAIPIVAYFDHNIFYNLNSGDDNKAFVYRKIPSYSVSRSMVDDWKKSGAPDLIFGYPKLEQVYGDSFSYSSYSLVEAFECGNIWKDKQARAVLPVFARNELLDEKGLTPLSDAKYGFLNGMISIEKIKEAYEAGIPVEEYLEPLFNELFGIEN